jgi:hypothetical protein
MRPTHADRIIDLLRAYPRGLDDDRISSLLGIQPRQTVNQVCRKLEQDGVLRRSMDSRQGKIVNVLSADTEAAPQAVDQGVVASAGTPAASESVVTQGVDHGDWIVLATPDDLRRFAYAGELLMAEDAVKEAVAAGLRAQGWQVEVRFGHEHGIDIVADRGSDKMIIEAKGEGSLNPMRVNYFLGALGELVQRMESPDVQYALALPAHRQFINLVLRLPTHARLALNLSVLFVRPGQTGIFDVGVYPAPGSTIV